MPSPVEPLLPDAAETEAPAPESASVLVAKPELPPAPIPTPSVVRSLQMGAVRRMILGLLFVLPIVLTVVVVYQIYRLLNQWIILPIAHLIVTPLVTDKFVAENVYWKSVESYVTPPISLAVALMILYLMGYLFQSRLNRWLDWIMERIPGISILYRAIRDASSAIHGPNGIKTIDKVVLVPFPHPGARATGYLMGESEDEKTGRRLACVYIPIALFPPSGYTLVFWYDDVTITDWDSASPWKMIISGGLTLPNKVPFRQ
jgi:uncharacterized membrane protein